MSVATIIIPTHDGVDTILDAVESARNQTVADIEIMIVGDGVSPEYRALIGDLVTRDERIVFHDLPKAPNRGERNRHEGVLRARSESIVYLADDDLLLPRHTENMVQLLSEVDLCQSRNGFIDENDRLVFYPTDLAERWCIGWHLLDPPRNRVSITGTAHTKSSYRRLNHGWETAPPGVWTDLHLWRQFFRLPDLRARTHRELTTLQFPATIRVGRDRVALRAQRDRWNAVIRDDKVDEIVRALVDDAELRQLTELSANVTDLTIELGAAHAEVDTLREQIERAESLISTLQARCEEESQRASAATTRADQAVHRIHDLSTSLEQVTNSRSWRYTAPARRLRAELVRLRKERS